MSDKLEKIEKPGALAVPEYLKQVHGQEGLENVTQDDLVLPRLSICQAMSPQRQRSKPNFIATLSDGDLFNTVTSEVYGNLVELIPLVYTKTRIYFRDIKEGGGILCQSFNGIDGGTISPTCEACPNSQFDENGNSPKCNVYMNFASLIMPTKQLIAASFKSTALKAARNWVTRMKMFNKPAFCQVYEIKVVEQQNTKGTFYAPVITFKRFADAAEFEFAQTQYAAIKGKVIKTDESLEHESDADEQVVSDSKVPF